MISGKLRLSLCRLIVIKLLLLPLRGLLQRLSPGEFGTELFKSSPETEIPTLLLLLCLRLRTVLSDSVDDWTSKVNGNADATS